MSFTSIQDAISYFAREYDSIVNVFRSHSAAMIANRIKQIEAEERSAALRAIGIKYKKL